MSHQGYLKGHRHDQIYFHVFKMKTFLENYTAVSLNIKLWGFKSSRDQSAKSSSDQLALLTTKPIKSLTLYIHIWFMWQYT